MDVDARREQLLSLALALFSSRPYAEVSVDEIARAAGISRGLLYHYFPSKRAFYIATLQTAAEQLLHATQVEARSTDGEAGLDEVALRAWVDAYLTYVEQTPEHYLLLLQGSAGEAEAQQTLLALRDALRRRLPRSEEAASVIDADAARRRNAQRGFLGFVEAACLDWIAHRDLPRATIRQTLVRAGLHALSLAPSR